MRQPSHERAFGVQTCQRRRCRRRCCSMLVHAEANAVRVASQLRLVAEPDGFESTLALNKNEDK